MDIEQKAPNYREVRPECCYTCKHREIDYDWEIYCTKYKGKYTGEHEERRNLNTTILALCDSYEWNKNYQWGF